MNCKIFVYRVFDIGSDLDLEKTQNYFLSGLSAQRFKLAKHSRAMIINNAPLSLVLDGGKYHALGLFLDYEISVKIWHFGAISVSLQIQTPDDLSWERLIKLGAHIENDPGMHEMAVQRVTQILQSFEPQRLKSQDWETYEDYTIYFFKNLPGAEKNAMNVLQEYDVFRLILSEEIETLSEQVKKNISDSALQYSQNDLALINWNSAVVVEPTGSQDIADVIEFALCQMLEMRYYDDLLDQKIASLYNELEMKKRSVWETYAE